MTPSDFPSVALQGFALGYFIGLSFWFVRKLFYIITRSFTPPSL